jgi:hypothetical protein
MTYSLTLPKLEKNNYELNQAVRANS